MQFCSTMNHMLLMIYVRFQFHWKETKSAVAGGDRLAKQLRLLGFKKRWEIIEEVRMEMLAYAAAHCPWKEHAQ